MGADANLGAMVPEAALEAATAENVSEPSPHQSVRFVSITHPNRTKDSIDSLVPGCSWACDPKHRPPHVPPSRDLRFAACYFSFRSAV